MPTIPLVNSPLPTDRAGTSNVLANPGMMDGLFRAQQRMGSAVEEIGQQGSELATRVKSATDMSYLIGADTKKTAVVQSMKAWTIDHPDTSTWNDELKSRMQPVIEDINAGAGSLGWMAKQHLAMQNAAWQQRTQSEFNILNREQSIKNAAGIATEGINAAMMNNDENSAHSIIDTAVSHGVFHPQIGAMISKRVTNGIASNQANLAAETDPFTAPAMLNEKNADGSYKNFSGLLQPARLTLLFRASRLANEMRTETMRDWQGKVIQAHNGEIPMPDKDGIMQEAQRQGISPKSVEALFKPQKTFDQDKYAELRSKIFTEYDPKKDTDNSDRAALTAQIYTSNFPAQTQSELLGELNNKSKPDHVYNSPTFKEAMSVNDKNFTLGAYGKYETKTKNDVTGEIRTKVNYDVLRQANETKERVRDSVIGFLKGKPDATNEEVTKFLAATYRKQAMQTGASLFKFNP